MSVRDFSFQLMRMQTLFHKRLLKDLEATGLSNGQPKVLAFLKSHEGLAKGSAFFKSLFFIPSLTSIIVAGIVFRLAFGTLETATMNRVMIALGQKPIKWLSYADSGNFVLILLTLWRWNGVNIVYYLSGLQSIPTDYYEAAQIDGANAIQKFTHVTLPGIRPVLIYVITITVLGRIHRLVKAAEMTDTDRKSTRLNSSHPTTSRMPSSA